MKTGITQTEKSLATQLYQTELGIAALEKDKEVLRAALLNMLKVQGVRSVKLDNGDMYVRAERGSLIIKDPTKALAFAKKSYALKIDTTKILKLIKPMLKPPTFFEIGRSEHLRILRRGNKDESNGEVESVD